VSARVRALFKRAAIERVALDLNDVIAEVLRLLRGETARKGVAVETNLEKDLPAVVGDRVQLQQLLLNLLGNGLDAMDPVVDRPKKTFDPVWEALPGFGAGGNTRLRRWVNKP